MPSSWKWIPWPRTSGMCSVHKGCRRATSRWTHRVRRRSERRRSRTREGAPMPLKVEPLDEPYLNMTAMVDVILNLLIFFMLGSHFAEEERQMDIQLPSVSHAQPLTAP